MSFIVLVLASGRGERFTASGGATHKLQAMLHGKTVLQRTLDVVQASGLLWHLEQGANPGMGDSIAAAVRATMNRADCEGWIVLPADLPLIQPATLRRVADAPADWPVVRAIHQNRQGHPVRFGLSCRDDLLALRGDAGAAAVVRKWGLRAVDVDDVGSITDIDTLDDLARAEELLRGR